MAKQKPGAIIRHDWKPLLQFLSDKEFRQFVLAAMDYASDGIECDFSGQLAMVWAFARPKLAEDKAAYESYRAKQQKKALKRWHGDELPEATEECHGIPQHTAECHGMLRDANDAYKDKKRTEENGIPPNPQGGLCAEVVEYLNQRIGSHFRANTKSTARHVSARISEGFTLDDFKAVVDFKAGQWEHDPKWSQYLRPDILFGTKMEGYVEAARRSKPEPKTGGDIYAGLL